jgi:thioredoxin reductase (NADPH)
MSQTKQDQYEVIILGTGPAGLQAAIHAARAKVSVLVMGREYKSSLYKAHVENYCCLSGVSGESLLQQGIQQAKESGAVFLHEDVIKTSQQDDGFVIDTESNRSLSTRALILAMGITRNKLGIPGETALLGKGVSYCVDCDANFYKGEKVAVVGDESAAVSGALTLLLYASEVHLVAESLQVSERLAELIKASAVRLHEGRKAREIIGSNQVDGLLMDNEQRLDVSGVFIETGAKGAIELAATLGVTLDDEHFQYIMTDKKQQTNIKGLYAAGDICGPPWQMAKAVGEGCVAGISAAKYVKKYR